jgi:hypothetical protein
MTTQTLPRFAPTGTEPEASAAPAAPAASPAGPVGHPTTLLTLRLLAALAMLASSYLHFTMALENGLGGPLFTMPQLFVGQAVVAAAAGGLLLVGDRELLWLGVLAVAIGSTVPILASVYFPLPAIGPMPPINEPLWYDEKILSFAVGATVPILWLIRRIAPPAKP